MSLQFNDIPSKTIFGCHGPLSHGCEGILKRFADPGFTLSTVLYAVQIRSVRTRPIRALELFKKSVMTMFS